MKRATLFGYGCILSLAAGFAARYGFDRHEHARVWLAGLLVAAAFSLAAFAVEPWYTAVLPGVGAGAAIELAIGGASRLSSASCILFIVGSLATIVLLLDRLIRMTLRRFSPQKEEPATASNL